MKRTFFEKGMKKNTDTNLEPQDRSLPRGAKKMEIVNSTHEPGSTVTDSRRVLSILSPAAAEPWQRWLAQWSHCEGRERQREKSMEGMVIRNFNTISCFADCTLSFCKTRPVFPRYRSIVFVVTITVKHRSICDDYPATTLKVRPVPRA
jgi:hypothetical protein